MSPQEISDRLWLIRDNLEKIRLEGGRTVAEMMKSKETQQALEQAFESCDEALLWSSDEYIWLLEDMEAENESKSIS